jgi:hypothetical protein
MTEHDDATQFWCLRIAFGEQALTFDRDFRVARGPVQCAYRLMVCGIVSLGVLLIICELYLVPMLIIHRKNLVEFVNDAHFAIVVSLMVAVVCLVSWAGWAFIRRWVLSQHSQHMQNKAELPRLPKVALLLGLHRRAGEELSILQDPLCRSLHCV